jgi:hypothetical protein
MSLSLAVEVKDPRVVRCVSRAKSAEESSAMGSCSGAPQPFRSARAIGANLGALFGNGGRRLNMFRTRYSDLDVPVEE